MIRKQKVSLRGIGMLALLAIIATCGLAVAVADGRSEVKRQLLEPAISFGIAEGYEVVGDANFESIDEKNSNTVGFTLRRGRQYAIVAVCDDEHDDVDVRLSDHSGELIDEGTDGDDVALLRGRPDSSGRYFVRLGMRDCDSDSYVIGAPLFRRN